MQIVNRMPFREASTGTYTNRLHADITRIFLAGLATGRVPILQTASRDSREHNYRLQLNDGLIINNNAASSSKVYLNPPYRTSASRSWQTIRENVGIFSIYDNEDASQDITTLFVPKSVKDTVTFGNVLLLSCDSYDIPRTDANVAVHATMMGSADMPILRMPQLHPLLQRAHIGIDALLQKI